MKKRLRLLAVLVLAFASCVAPAASRADPAAAHAPLKVAASFSIIADMVRTIGGDAVDVSVLVGPGMDAHAYQPTPADIRKLARTGMLFVNGLGFEPWLDRVIASSGYKGEIVTLTKGVTPRELDEGEDDGHGHGHEHAHEHGGHDIDPHAWQSLANARIYAANIANALAAALPAQAKDIRARARVYDAAMGHLDADIRARIGAVPEDRRKIIVGHAAFGYFEDAYAITILAPQGISTQDDPSAAAVANLTEQIRREKISTVFAENMTNKRLSAQMARDGGAALGPELFSDALSPAGGPAPTYLDMMRHNADAILGAIEKNGR